MSDFIFIIFFFVIFILLFLLKHSLFSTPLVQEKEVRKGKITYLINCFPI